MLLITPFSEFSVSQKYKIYFRTNSDSITRSSIFLEIQSFQRKLVSSDKYLKSSVVLVCIEFIKFILENIEIRGLWHFIPYTVHQEMPQDPSYDKNADHSLLVTLVT